MPYDAVIIGAGAAGLMCALTAGQRGRRVLVIEHARQAGRKILMSGGGRCNFTNLHAEPDNYLSANPHYCKSALARYTQWDFIALVERHGIGYHEKEAGQLFCDSSSKAIVGMLLRECEEAGVEIALRCSLEAAEAVSTGFRLRTSRGEVNTPQLVLASGGLSIPKMGATGLAYELAGQFGHAIEPTRAGLVPLTLSGLPLQQWSDLSGLSHQVTISTAARSFEGGLLITHRGISGPAVLQVSSYWQPGSALTIDWLPGRDAPAELLAAKSATPATTPESWLSRHMPRRLAQRLCELCGMQRPLSACRDTDLRDFGQRLGHWQLKPSGTEGYRTAEVTLGGIATDQLSSASMQSHLQPGLYCIGEAVDVTGHLGGFNFQWAWASGHAAGECL